MIIVLPFFNDLVLISAQGHSQVAIDNRQYPPANFVQVVVSNALPAEL
jgi:hypothetical protein